MSLSAVVKSLFLPVDRLEITGMTVPSDNLVLQPFAVAVAGMTCFFGGRFYHVPDFRSAYMMFGIQCTIGLRTGSTNGSVLTGCRATGMLSLFPAALQREHFFQCLWASLCHVLLVKS